jgi:uncharacterized membrane-anchored protein
MSLMAGLLRRSQPDLPGLTGIARVDRRTDALLKRLRPGDIAVVDHIDLDRRSADAFVAAGVVAVVNAAPSISGRYPSLGAEVLIEAGIVLLDRVGPDAVHVIRDGSRVRILDDTVLDGETVLVSGVLQDADSVADDLVEAKSGLGDQLEALSANTSEFMRHERGVLLDGAGIPEVAVDLRDRHVLVVAAGQDSARELEGLRGWIGEWRPVMVGVGAGADTLLAAKYVPDLIVGDPADVSHEALVCGAEVMVPVDPGAPGSGMRLVQDLGAMAHAVSSTANPEDLALLLAAHRGATLVVTVGLSASMAEFLDRGRSTSNASTFLTRLRLGSVLVDATAVSMLHRNRISPGLVWLLILAVVLVGVAAVSVSAVGDAVLAWLGQAWTAVLDLLGGAR